MAVVGNAGGFWVKLLKVNREKPVGGGLLRNPNGKNV